MEKDKSDGGCEMGLKLILKSEIGQMITIDTWMHSIVPFG